MPTSAEIFDWACQNKWKDDRGRIYGTRYNPTDPAEKPLFDLIADRAKLIFRGCQTLFPRLPQIHFAYIDNGSPNALADIVDKVPCVGVFRGAVLLLHDWFQRMLSHPNIFVGLGNNWDEIKHPQHRDGIEQDIDDLRDNRRSLNEPTQTISPIDPVRQRYAISLLVTAFDFLIGHEVGHLGRGHVDYLHIKRGLPFVLEAGSTPTEWTPELAREFQTLEFDADAIGAASVSLHFLLINSLPYPLSTPQQKLYFWTIAVASVFYMFDLRINPSRLELASHPPPIFRLTLLRKWAPLVVKKQCPDVSAETDQVLTTALDGLSAARSFLGAELSANYFDEALTDNVQERIKRQMKVIDRHAPTLMRRVSKYDYASKSV